MGGRQSEEKGKAAEVEGNVPAAQDGPFSKLAWTRAKTHSGRHHAVYPAAVPPFPAQSASPIPLCSAYSPMGTRPCSGPWGEKGCLLGSGGERHPFWNTGTAQGGESLFSPFSFPLFWEAS